MTNRLVCSPQTKKEIRLRGHFHRLAVVAKKQGGIQKSMDRALATQLVQTAFVATPGVAGGPHTLKGGAAWFGLVAQTGFRNFRRFCLVHPGSNSTWCTHSDVLAWQIDDGTSHRRLSPWDGDGRLTYAKSRMRLAGKEMEKQEPLPGELSISNNAP